MGNVSVAILIDSSSLGGRSVCVVLTINSYTWLSLKIAESWWNYSQSFYLNSPSALSFDSCLITERRCFTWIWTLITSLFQRAVSRGTTTTNKRRNGNRTINYSFCSRSSLLLRYRSPLFRAHRVEQRSWSRLIEKLHFTARLQWVSRQSSVSELSSFLLRDSNGN